MSDFEIPEVAEEEKVVPSSIGIFSDEVNQQACIDYLVRELGEVSTNAGRQIKIDRNKTIARQRLAQPENATKDFPWPNASNIEPTFALQKTNIIVTKIVQAFKAKKPMFMFNAAEPYEAHAEAITRLVQLYVASPFKIDLYNKLWGLIYNCVSYGTQFTKVPFVVEYMKFNRIGEDGSTEVVDRVKRASPDVIALPFEDFMTRAEWHDLQRAPWAGVRYYKHTHELLALQQQGFYINVDQMITAQQTLDDSKTEEMEYLGEEASGGTDRVNYWYNIFEVNIFWDADGDGFPEDIVIHFERETGTILRAEYNELGTRDYVRTPYIEIPNNLYGLGVGDIMIPLQDEASSLHNMRNDSMQLSMMPFLITAQGSGMGADLGIYPGKTIEVAVPNEDVRIEKFPDVSMSSMSAEALLKSYADEATGASDILSGNDVGGYNRIGASGTQFLAGQSNTLLDAISDNIAVAFGEIGMLILLQLVRNSDYVELETLGISDADKILCAQVLEMNVEDIHEQFLFRSRVSAIQDSRETKQQQAMSLFQLYTMYTDKMIQLSAQIDNPQLQQAPRVLESVSTAMVGLTTLMEGAMTNFDTDNVGDFTIYVRDLKEALRMSDSQKEEQVDGVQTAMASQASATVGEGISDDPTAGRGPSDPVGAEPGGGQIAPAPDGGEGALGGEPV